MNLYPVIEGPEFVLFDTVHLLTLAVTFGLIVGIPLLMRRIGSDVWSRRVAASLAVLLVIAEIVRAWIWVENGSRWILHLPLQLCGISTLLIAVVLIWRSYRVYEVVYFWGLVGTVQALITPDVPTGYPHPLYLGFYLGHGLIVLGIVYATFVFGMRPTPRSILRAFVTTLIYAFAIVAPVNWWLGTNYMYLSAKPEAASLLDALGPWPWYLVNTALLALVLFCVYYLPFYIHDLMKSRSDDLIPNAA